MHFCDFAIITALLEERDAVRKAFPELKELPGGTEVYYHGYLSLGRNASDRYSIVLAALKEMGEVPAVLETEKLINEWNPQHIVVVGIAGRMNDDVKLCDVVISNRVLHYDSVKVTSTGTRYRPQSYPANGLLLKQLQTLTGRRDYKMWRSQVGRSVKKMGAELNSPEVHFGTILSGSQVIAAVEKKAELLRLDDKIVAAEMEMGGVMAAVYSRADPKRAITIRGISDTADAGKSNLDNKKFYRKFAASSAARLMRTFLLGGPVDPLRVDTFQAHLALGTAASARKHLRPIPKSSHLAFECAIVPCGPAKTLSLELQATNTGAKPIRLIEAIATYRDFKGDQIKRLTPDSTQLVMRCQLDDVSPAPISLYAATDGQAGSAVLKVKTRTQEERLEWISPSQRSE